jgi:hypothetical protein
VQVSTGVVVSSLFLVIDVVEVRLQFRDEKSESASQMVLVETHERLADGRIRERNTLPRVRLADGRIRERNTLPRVRLADGRIRERNTLPRVLSK